MTPPLDSNITRNTIKLLYSYGGKVLPRPTNGQLRYVGGYTRVLAVERSITYAELMVKFGELCGLSMNLKCKLPNEDLDLLVTITCDEDLASAIEEYDRVSISSNKDMKIRAILFPHIPVKKDFYSFVSVYGFRSRLLPVETAAVSAKNRGSSLSIGQSV